MPPRTQERPEGRRYSASAVLPYCRPESRRVEPVHGARMLAASHGPALTHGPRILESSKGAIRAQGEE
jgi:hypothetical protein